MKKITLLLMLLSIPFFGIAQTFEFNNSDDGWDTYINFTATLNATYMTLTTTPGDGTLKNPNFSTTSAGVDTSLGSYIGVTLKNGSADGPTFLRVSYPKQSGGRVYKSIDITNGDTGFKTYWIDLANQNWTGTMDDIKIQFKNSDGSNSGVDFILPTTSIDIDIDKIEFAAQPTTSEQHIYEFDTDNDAEGWQGVNGTISGPTSGVLTFTPDQNKYAKIKQLSHHVDATQYSRVHITLKNQSTDDDELRFIFNGDAPNAIDYQISTNDSDFVTYDIDLSSSSAWTGDVLVTIAFRDADNPNQPGQSSGTGDFLIDRIEFTNQSAVDKNTLSFLDVYPNPATDFIKVQTENPIAKITVYDMTGKVVYRQFNTDRPVGQIDISQYNSGIYLVKVEDENHHSSTCKFVKFR